MATQPSLRELVAAKEERGKNLPSRGGVEIEDAQAFGFDVMQKDGSLQGYPYHHLVLIDFKPGERDKGDELDVLLWAYEGKIMGYALRKLAKAMARGYGLTIGVQDLSLAEATPEGEPFVFYAVFKKRKSENPAESDTADTGSGA